MSDRMRRSFFAALKAAGTASILCLAIALGTGTALADPAPGDPVAGPAAGQDPTPFIGTAPFGQAKK